MKIIIKALVLVLIAAVVTGTPAAAKSYFDLVTIAGPDWYGEIELRGSEIPESLTHGGFFDPQESVSPPANLGRGYLITRGYEDGEARRMHDRFMYFPGSPGYVYYLEIVDGYGSSDGHWFLVDDGYGEELLSILESKGVYFATRDTTSAEADAPPLPGENAYALGLTGVGFAGIALGWYLRALRDRTRLVRATERRR